MRRLSTSLWYARKEARKKRVKYENELLFRGLRDIHNMCKREMRNEIQNSF
jgi:hypothetical protein